MYCTRPGCEHLRDIRGEAPDVGKVAEVAGEAVHVAVPRERLHALDRIRRLDGVPARGKQGLPSDVGCF